MDFLFGKKMTPDEMLRKNQRALNRAMRDLDRERAKMEQQEKKIIADIKKMAKQGQMDAVKIMAKVSRSINQSVNHITVLIVALTHIGFSANATLREKVHVDARQYSGRESQDSDVEEPERDGAGHEGRHQSHAEHEQATQVARDTKNHDGIRETERNDGHEGGDHDGRHRRRPR